MRQEWFPMLGELNPVEYLPIEPLYKLTGVFDVNHDVNN